MAKTSFQTNEENVRTYLRQLFTKLPPLSTSANDLIERIFPWIVLVVGVIKTFSIVSLLSPFLFGTNTILYLGSCVVGVLLLIAFFKLIRHEYLGWQYTFWAILLNILVSAIVQFLGAFVIGAVILYILFQLEPRYKRV